MHLGLNRYTFWEAVLCCFLVSVNPLLLMAFFSAVYIKRLKFKQFLIPAMYLVAGVFMIIRGSNLDVKYVSAGVNSSTGGTVCR